MMNAFDALMPAHSALSIGVRPSSGAATSTVPARGPDRELPIRKYIILAHPTGDGPEQVLLFDRDVQHIDALPRYRVALSAGYCIVTGDSRVILMEFPSHTLRLGPRPQDKQILQQFIGHP
jgi:hypothetical protein